MADTIGHLLAAACQRFRDRPALVRGTETRTYSELLDRGLRLASALRGAGLEPGTPVAAMLEDRIESLEVYLGAFFGGYPVIHVNDRLAAPEVAHILADSGARALFHTDGRSAVADASGARNAVRLLVTIGADRPPGAEGFEDVVSRPRSVQRIEPRSAGDLAIVGYISGTTGLPKGAMISQGALTACVRLMPSMFRISPYGRCAFTGTLSFASGIWGVILPHLYSGGTVTFLHPYTPESWAAHVELDPAGYVCVTGRVKDLIISGGMNVYPAEVEAALTEDQVIAHVRTRIAGYKRPRRVHFAAALPRNASMKVRKDQLRDQLAREGSPRA